MKTGISDIIYRIIGLSICAFLFFPTVNVQAQSDIELDMVLTPQLKRAQVLSLTNLGINKRGSGEKLFDFIVKNNTAETQSDLYFNVTFSSGKNGLLAEFYQDQTAPFSLDANQLVSADNNQLADGLPGVEEVIRFKGGLTETGEDFLNNLEGSSKLPNDTYTIGVSILRNNNSQNGGIVIDEVTSTVGSNLTEDIGALYLVQPGDVLGSDATISSKLPVFRWDGPRNIDYRLVVVEDDGENSAESLLQSAESSDPTINKGTTGSGSLLEYEMVDAIVNSTSFNMPPSGVQQLEEGEHYYWQVSALQEGVGSTNVISSEIWSFTVAESSSQQEIITMTEEAKTALESLLSSGRFQELTEEGFSFNAITIDGQTMSGAAALQQLLELQEKIENEEITIVEE